jgi:hypothetical protein
MMRGSELSREDKMRAIASLIAAVGVLSAGATVAGAMPADGAAIARLAQQVDAVVAVKKGKKSKTRTTGTPTAPPRQPSQSY